MIKEIPILPLRDYQAKAWDYLMEHNTRRSFFIWHRRAGKDLFGLQYLVARAMVDVGNYWYILPQQNQVRRAIWEGITSKGTRYLDLIPEEAVYKKSEQEMKITLRDPINPNNPGSIISFLGGDRYDTLVGAGIKGCVISEYALQRPNLYDLAIQPMLMESRGWVMFNTTPRGQNHAYDMYRALKDDPEAYTSLLTIEDTGVMDLSDIEIERKRGKPEEIIQQEFYCSWAGAIHGAYYADVLQKAEVGDFPYDPRYPVHTCWDLGVSDSMAIWFVQFINGTIRLIDYYEASTFGLGHYADVVLSKGYRYVGHHLPHDGVQRQLTPTEKAQSIQGQLLTLGLNNVDIIPRTKDVYADIQAVRGILPICRFDNKCKQGYQALQNYRREYDEDRKCFKNNPLHDWASHACLVWDTKVLTTEGEKNIIDVRVGDYVITPMGKRRVLRSGMTGIKGVIELNVGDKKLVCTPDHKIFTKNGLENADTFRYNTDVFSIMKGERILWNTLSLFGFMEGSIGYREIITRATTGEVEQNFTERYGKNTLANLYLMAITFIILMEIPLITIYQTLYALVRKSICLCTQSKTNGVEAKQTRNNCAKHKSLLSYGTQAKKVLNGIVSKVRKVGKSVSGVKQYVLFVVKNIKRPTQLVLDIVARNASQNISIIRKRGRHPLAPVFNLTIEKDHCFYANGVLVSNCDAFRIIPIIERTKVNTAKTYEPKTWGGMKW